MGFSEELDDGTYLRTLGDDIILLFDIDQDIESLDGNPKMTIAYDKSNYDAPFDYILKGASFGKGAFLLQHEYYNHDIPPIRPYTNYLEASGTGVANTRVEINEEGKYDGALDYLVKNSGLGGKTNGYRMSFSFEVSNGDTVVFLRDAKTTSELQNNSITKNGFKIDFAKSHTVKVHVTRKVVNIDGTALDVRVDKPAHDGEVFTDKGYYTIEMTNTKTEQSVTKYIFVGDKADLHEYVQIDPELVPFVRNRENIS